LSERLATRVGQPARWSRSTRAWKPRLRETLASFAHVTLHLTDALRLDLTALDPAPGKVVANLPYGIAATMILRTVDELPGVRSGW